MIPNSPLFPQILHCFIKAEQFLAIINIKHSLDDYFFVFHSACFLQRVLSINTLVEEVVIKLLHLELLYLFGGHS